MLVVKLNDLVHCRASTARLKDRRRAQKSEFLVKTSWRESNFKTREGLIHYLEACSMGDMILNQNLWQLCGRIVIVFAIFRSEKGLRSDLISNQNDFLRQNRWKVLTRHSVSDAACDLPQVNGFECSDTEHKEAEEANIFMVIIDSRTLCFLGQGGHLQSAAERQLLLDLRLRRQAGAMRFVITLVMIIIRKSEIAIQCLTKL